jgi:hypothetical protein
MKHAALGVALVTALASLGAHAASYFADISGSGIHQTESDNIPFTWSGTVSVVTDGTQDGTYTGDTLESITVVTDIYDTVFDWSYTKGQTQVAWEYAPWQFILVGPEPGASVIVAGGRLAGVNLVYDDYFSIDTMSGMNVTADTTCRIDGTLCHGAPNNYDASGTLTASGVPEPTGAALLLAGLGLAGLCSRRRSAR